MDIDLLALLDKPVWVQVSGYGKLEPADTDYDEGILVSVVVDEMGMWWAIVRWDEEFSTDPDRISTRFPWFRFHAKMPLVVQEAIYGSSDDGAFDPEPDYDERHNYIYGSSATGLPSY